MNIAICDDIPAQLDLIEHAIRNCPYWSGEALSISRFHDGASLLRSVESDISYSFIFLDIRMPQVSGVELYSKLARNDTSVIFVSAHMSYLPETHALRAPGFLPKPYTQHTFDRTVQSALAQRTQTQFFTYYDFDGKEQTLPCSDIYYFSAGEHFIYAHTASGKVSAYGVSLKDMETQFSPHGFFCCSKSALVNLRHCDDRKANTVVFKQPDVNCGVAISRRKLLEYDRLCLLYRWR